MDQVRWAEIKRVLGEALAKEDDGRRARFLKKSCAHDTALRREVESLLSRSTERLEQVADDMRTSRLSVTRMAGQRIGAYLIVRELGRGGMGAVYLARRDDSEFQKEVAIKLLKRGMDTDEVLRRFRAEREILARLEHPNIARLLDGGTTEDGLPYFIMEYVKGVPLGEFCSAKKLGLDERLRLFLKICAAVRFAHQNLVVHRDLKPANLLVDEEGEPKLLDFGIAKLLAPGEGAFEVTMLDQQRLTPAYASPEQVLGEPITTVSDVYSLGTVLYEILSGRPAHAFSTLHPASEEWRRLVVKEDVTRPSLATSDPAMARRLRGDLDNIVLKALRKEPERRYGGVGDFAEDIRRHLDDRPIRARPDTMLYRTSKLIKRNKVSMIAAVAVVGVLILGTIVTTLEAREARRARARAEQRFNDLRKVANSFMLELNTAIKDLPGSLAARQMLTSHALEYLDSLSLEAGDDLSLKNELATAYEKLGLVTFDVEQALGTHGKAARLNEELVRAAPSQMEYRTSLAKTYANLSDVYKIAGDSSLSIDFARKAVAQAEAVAQRSATAMAMMELGNCHESLAAALADAGQYREAVEAAKSNVHICEEMEKEAPPDRDRKRELAEAYGMLSDDFRNLGEDKLARDYAARTESLTRELLAADPTSARNQRDMWIVELRSAQVFSATGKSFEARAAFDRALGLIGYLSAADPSDRGHRYCTASTYLAIGGFELAEGKLKESAQSIAEAMAIEEKLLLEDRGRVEAQRDLRRGYELLAEVHARTGEKAKELEARLKSESLGQNLIRQDPGNLKIKARLAETETALGDSYAKEAPLRSRQYYKVAAGLWHEIKDRGELRPQDEGKVEGVEAKLR